MEQIKRLWSFRKILWGVSVKQLKEKYAGAKLGIWWAVITPLILAISINFIFTKVFKITLPNYTLFVLSGIIPWFFFSNTIGEAANSFTTNYSILKQNIFPREIIPISSVIANLFNFLIGLFFLLPLFVILNYQVLAVLYFLLPIILSYLLFIIGLGLVFSCVNVFFRDLSQILSLVFMIWFWITPVFYSVDMLPLQFRWVCIFNPVSYFILMFQDVLFKAEIPPLKNIFISFFIGISFLISGYCFFIKKEKIILKKI